MNTLVRRCALLLASLGVIDFALASTATAQQGVGNPPWHLVDLWWDLGEARTFESLAIDFELSDDVPETVNLYIAPIGLGKLSGTSFYGGIQTQIGPLTATRSGQRLTLGRGAIFSRWDERSLDAVRLAQGGGCESSGYEGNFISVRNRFAWTKGQYTLQLRRMDVERIDDKPHTWVGMFMYGKAGGDERYVGAMRFPGAPLTLDRHLASFVEIYGRRIPLDKIPKLDVTIAAIRVNGQPIAEPHVRAIYPQGVPDYANAEAAKPGVVIHVGQPVERTQRAVRLF